MVPGAWGWFIIFKHPNDIFLAGLIEKKIGKHIGVVLNGGNLPDYG